MKFTLEDLKATKAGKLPSNAGVLGAVQNTEHKSKPGGSLEQVFGLSETGRTRLAIGGPIVRATIVSFRTKTLDSDNLCAGAKGIRDAIARSCGLDDADSTIEWEYRQVITKGQQGTLVKIERI